MKKQGLHSLLSLTTVLCLVGCTTPTFEQRHQDLPIVRPADGLLTNTSLQRIAELQQAKNGDQLRTLLKHEDPAIRARAAFAFGSFQDDQTLTALLPLLDDPVPNVRRDAAFAIRQNTDAVDAGLLNTHFIQESDRGVRMVLLGTLGFKGDANSYESIFSHSLNGLEKAQCLSASYYLSRGIVSQTGADLMLEYLQGNDSNLWNHAGTFFTKYRTKDPVLAEQFRNLLTQRGYGFIAAPHLLKYIATLKNEQDIPLFKKWIKNGERQLARVYSIRALEPFNDQPAIRQYFIDLLEHSEPAMAFSAAEALGKCKQLTDSDLDALVNQLNQNRIARNEIPYLLELLWSANRKEQVHHYIASIPSNDPLAFVVAIHRLPELEWTYSKERLEALYTSENPQVQLLVNQCLSYKIFKANKAQSRILQDHLYEYVQAIPSSSVRVDCLITIADCMEGNPAAYDPKAFFSKLTEIYLAEDDAYSAAICLVKLGHLQDESLRPLIEKGLSHTNPFISAAAQGALSFYDMPEKAAFVRYKFLFNPKMKFDWNLLRSYGRFPCIRLKTNKGDIVIRLDAEQTPQSVQNIITSVQEGIFDKTSFYRFLPSFVTQVGVIGQNGRVNPSEFNHQLMEYHVVNTGGPNPDSMSQHLIFSHLLRPDREQAGPTIGYVIEGHDVCDRLARFDTVHTAELIRSK